MTVTPFPRAARNRNPGNIETGEPWRGLAGIKDMTADQRGEHRFCVFIAPEWGFRALAIIIRNYRDRYGLLSVRDIISRYAPSNENDTAAYVKHVCDAMGVEPDKALDLDDALTLEDLCRAIAVHESGGWFFKTPDLEKGVAMALGPKSEPRIA